MSTPNEPRPDSAKGPRPEDQDVPRAQEAGDPDPPDAEEQALRDQFSQEPGGMGGT